MADKKLRLALPLGKLVEPNKWNVASVLKQAGIIDYQKGDRKVAREILDPEIEPSFLKPRDIPIYLRRGICDVGITGRDIVEESREPLEELCDMGCGYVDLNFMTTQEVWHGVQALWTSDQIEKLQKSNIIPKGIELLLTHLYNQRLDARELKDHKPCIDTYNLKAICGTEYPLMLEQIRKELKVAGDLSPPRFNVSLNEPRDPHAGALADIEVFLVHGQTEQLLRDCAVDFILETVATGDSSRDFALVEKVLDSTARMYHNPKLNQEDSWKQRKIQEIRERIEAVTKDIDNHYQARIAFGDGPALHRHRHVEKLFRAYGFSLSSTEGVSAVFPWGSEQINFVFSQVELPNVRKMVDAFLNRGVNWEYTDVGNGIGKLAEATCYSLQSLYAYCPLFLEDVSANPGEESKSTIRVLQRGKYQCADSTKLRPEHRERAILFELPKERSKP